MRKSNARADCKFLLEVAFFHWRKHKNFSPIGFLKKMEIANPPLPTVEGIKSALSLSNFCTFTGLFLSYILKLRLGQHLSICSQNHFALCLSTAGLSCCKFCFKNDEKMAKSEIKWPGFWLCTKIVYQNMNLELYCQEFKRAISMCPKDRKKWAKTGRNGQK